MTKRKKPTSDDEENGNGNGNGGNGPTLFHPWKLEDEPARAEPLPEPEAMDEYHLDHQGRKRLFRLRDYGRGPASFLNAQEIRDGEVTGWRFVIAYNGDTEIAPWGEIREKIRARLASRDLAREPDSGRLEALTDLIRAQVSSTRDQRKGPPLIIDGDVVTWRELGELIASYEGWGLRIQITEPGDE